MANPIPKWVMIRYSKLWKRFNEEPASYEDIEKVLKLDDKRIISVFLNELKKAGWINIKLDEKDMRKRQYSLKNPAFIVEEIAKQK